MLVAALEVEIGRHAEVRIALADGLPRYARLEPDIHDDLLFFQVGPAALRALRARRQKVLLRPRVPGRDAFLLEDVRDVLHPIGVDDGLAALRAVERRNRHAP